MQVTSMLRLCVVAGVLLVHLAPPAAAIQNFCSSGKCVTIGSVNCKFGNPDYTGSRFKGAQFEGSCLGDAGFDCAHKSNTAQPGNKDKSCCGCFLYATKSHGKSGDFVTTGVLGDDFMVLPTAACTGVENWDNPKPHTGCPGEKIWDFGRDQLKSKDATWGMAINPVSLRGQHQMHVHLGEMWDDLVKAIGAAHKQSSVTKAYLDCSGKKLQSCTVRDQSKGGDKNNDIYVQIFRNIGNPSDAKPFENAYGANPNKSNPLVLRASTLVAPVKGTGFKDWVVITNPKAQAECFFKGTAGHC